MRFSNLGANAVLATAAALTLVNAGLMTTTLTGFAHITEQLGRTLVAGPQGPTGVVAATAPLIYDAETQTLSLNLDQVDRLGALG